MHFPFKRNELPTADAFLLAVGGVVVAAALLGLVGWHTANVRLIQFGASASLQYNSALSFLFLGLGFIALGGRLSLLVAFLAPIPVAIGTITLIEYAIGVEVGLHQWLFRALPDGGPLPQRIAPNTALGVVFIGVAQWLLARTFAFGGGRSLFVAALGTIATAIAGVGAFGYVIDVDTTYRWGRAMAMAPQAAAMLVLSGATVVMAAWRAEYRHKGLPRWLPLLVATGGVAMTLVLWQALLTQERAHVRRAVEAEAVSVKNEITARLQARVHALVRMGDRWAYSQPGRAQWEYEALLNIRNYPGYRSIQWVGPDHRVRWVFPLSGNERAVGMASDFDAARSAALEQARRQRTVTATPVVDLVTAGTSGFRVHSPIYARDRFLGFIVGVFEVQTLFDTVLTGIAPMYAVRVVEGERAIYTRDAVAQPPRGVATADLPLYGRVWRVQLWPTPEMYRTLYTKLPTVVLIGGFLLSGLLAGLAYLAQISYLRRLQLEVKNNELAREAAERRQAQREIEDRTGYVALLQGVAVAANEAVDIESAAARAIEAVCEQTGWAIGHLFLCPRDQPNELVSTSVWRLSEPTRFAPFKAASEQIHFAYGIGLPGRVLVRGGPVWWLNLAEAASFPRLSAAAAGGIVAGYAFPIMIKTKVAGVLEFFATHSEPPPALLLEVMTQVGTQLGRVLERARAAEDLRASEVRFRAVTDSAHDAIVSSDVSGAILGWNQGAVKMFGYRAEEVLGKSLTLLMPERYRARHEAGMARLMVTRNALLAGQVLQLAGLRKNGEEFPIEITLGTWVVGEEMFCSGIMRDVSARHAAEARIRRSERQLATAEAIAHLGSWHWDIASNAVSWSDEMYRIYGLQPNEVTVDYDFFIARVHVDDREAVRRRLDRAYREGGHFELDHRIVLPNGDVRVLEAYGEVITDATGTPTAMVGTGQDVTERRRAEAEIRRLNADLERRVQERTEALTAANAELAQEIVQREGLQATAQARAAQHAALAALSQRALVGGNLHRFFDEAMPMLARTLKLELTRVLEYLPERDALLLRAGHGWREGLVGQALVSAGQDTQSGLALAQAEPLIVADLRLEPRFTGAKLARDHGVVSSVCVAIPGGERPYGVLAVHSTERREFGADDLRFLQAAANVLAAAVERDRGERERNRLLEQEQAARAEAEASRQRLRFLADASALLNVSLDYEMTLANIAQLSVPFFADWCAVDMVDDGRLRRVKVAHIDPDKERLAYELGRRWPTDMNGSHGAAKVVRTGAGEMVAAIGDEVIAGVARDAEHLAILRSLNLRSYIAVPLLSRERVLGVITFVYAESNRQYNEADLRLAEQLAHRCAVAVDNARLFQLAQEELQERLEAERSLAAEKERLAVTLYSIGDGVITVDTEGRVVLLNKVAEQLTGWRQAEAEGRPVAEVFNIVHERTREPGANPVMEVLRHGEVVTLANHTVLIARDGTERNVADSGAPIRDKNGDVVGVVLVFRDVTEQQKLEDELIKVRNLESIGLLAGGIAHDFNNILTAILGNIALAKMYSKPGDRVFETLSEAEKAFARARDLTQQLLTFAKGGTPIKQTGSIAELLRDTTTFALRGSSVRVEFKLADDLWPVAFDVGQMSQVINNLVINAKQAMPTGGSLTVTAQNVGARKHKGIRLPAGRFVKIAIADTGAGIEPRYLEKIFDPYFTTKPSGTGLGLATTYSIVKKHEGVIDVQSTLGKGTTFTLYLPALSTATRAEVMGGDDVYTGSGRVLIMDDEETIREIARALLERLGYEVEFAGDGAETLQRYRAAQAEARPFDAVIMDLTVPGGMGGKECMQQLLTLDPNAKGIVSSGYSNDPVMADYAAHGFRGVIAKPYQVKELSQTLYRVIVEDSGHRGGE